MTVARAAPDSHRLPVHQGRDKRNPPAPVPCAPLGALCNYVPVPTPSRSDDPGPAPGRASDRCPGLLRPHRADDGAMVRLRAPGGRIPAPAFAALRTTACGYGDGDIHLTSRANIQLRSLPTDQCGAIAEPVAATLHNAGFLPSATHERVRNIVASPLSGLEPGRPDVRRAVARLDAAVCAEPALAGLSGRFLFGLDDGGGDVARLGCDVLAVAESAAADSTVTDSTAGSPAGSAAGNPAAETYVARLWAGDAAGPRVALSEAPGAMVALALRFIDAAEAADPAGGRWRVRELPDRGRELIAGPAPGSDGLGPAPGGDRAPTPGDPGHGDPVPYGVLAGGALSVSAPLGVLTPAQSRAISASAGPDGTVIVTPQRGLVIVPGGPPAGGLERLTAAGLVADAASPWARISACIGSPGCAKSAGDTRTAARALAAHGGPDHRTHVIGCPRACGAPKSDHTLVQIGSNT